MRTLRVSLAGLAIMALLGGLSGVVLAQEGVEGQIFTIESTEVLTEGDFDASGNEIITMAKEASDPRMSGTWTEAWGCRPGSGFEVCVASVRVDNEGGTWLGRAEGFSGPPAGAYDLTLFEGQGDYAGLMALRQVTFHPERGEVDVGVIFEGELPPLPELPTE